jgi:hypothetical protein
MTLTIKGNKSLIIGIIAEFITAYVLMTYMIIYPPEPDIAAITVSAITLCVALIILSGVIMLKNQE